MQSLQQQVVSRSMEDVMDSLPYGIEVSAQTKSNLVSVGLKCSHDLIFSILTLSILK